MDTIEYLEHLTGGLIKLEKQLKDLETVTVKAFTYTFDTLGTFTEQINEIHSSVDGLQETSYIGTQTLDNIHNSLTDLYTQLNSVATDTNNLQEYVDTQLTTINENISNIDKIATTSEKKTNQFFKKLKTSTYNFIFYFKIRHERKLQIIAEEKKRQELEEKRKAEEEQMRIEEERLRKIKEEQQRQQRIAEEQRKQREAERKKQEELQRIKQQQKDNNTIYNILNNIGH